MTRAAIVLLLTAAMSSMAFAQSRPTFAGEWARSDTVAARPPAGGGALQPRGNMGSTWGSPLTIVQSSDSLVVTFTHFNTYDLQAKLRYAYTLAGAESRNTIMIGHAESVQRSRAQWAGDTLVITTVYAAPPGPDGRPLTAELRQALALTPSGTLLIESTRSGVLGGPPSTVRTTYARR